MNKTMNKAMNKAMKKTLVVLVGLVAAVAQARPVLQPEVKEYQATEGESFAVKDLPVVHSAGDTLEAAAGEVRAEGGRMCYAGGGLPEKGVLIATAGTDFGKLLVKRFALDVPAKKQGYAIWAAKDFVAIVGHDDVGAFYGAETFRQMAVSGMVEPATVRDCLTSSIAVRHLPVADSGITEQEQRIA